MSISDIHQLQVELHRESPPPVTAKPYKAILNPTTIYNLKPTLNPEGIVRVGQSPDIWPRPLREPFEIGKNLSSSLFKTINKAPPLLFRSKV